MRDKEKNVSKIECDYCCASFVFWFQSDEEPPDEADRDLLAALVCAFFEPDLDEREEADDEARDSLGLSSIALADASVLSAATAVTTAVAAAGALDSDPVDEDDEEERVDLDEPEDEEEEEEDELDDDDRDEPDEDRDDEDLRRLVRLDSRERLSPRRSRLLSRRVGGPRSTGRRRS